LRSAAVGGKAFAIRSAALVDSCCPETLPSELSPRREVIVKASAATTASPQSPSVRHGCSEHARASLSVKPCLDLATPPYLPGSEVSNPVYTVRVRRRSTPYTRKARLSNTVTIEIQNERKTLSRRAVIETALAIGDTVATLFSSTPAEISQNGARVVEYALGVLRRAGFPPEEAALVESECERFILGSVVLEIGGGPQLCPFKPNAHSHDAHTELALLPLEEFPNLLEALPYFTRCKDADWAFEFALDLIVGGIDRMLENGHSQLGQS